MQKKNKKFKYINIFLKKKKKKKKSYILNNEIEK